MSEARTSRVCALTGGRGYVGGAIRRGLEAAGWRVLLLARGARGEEGIRWSLQEQGQIGPELRARGVTALVHAAWDFAPTDADAYASVNLGGSRRLFAAAANDAGVERLVFISTISAFEGAKSIYGRVKLAAEKAAAEYGGLIVRPGLVYGSEAGQEEGGVFGAMTKQVKTATVLPVIGSGKYPQYLVYAPDLGRAVADAVSGKWRGREGKPVTVAHPQMWEFEALVKACAARAGRDVKLIHAPWRLVYAGLKTGEKLGMKLPFRSDSVLSLVNQNPAPDFSSASELGLELRPFPEGLP